MRTCLDTSFDPGQGVGAVDTIAVQPDGKYIIGGEFSTVNGISQGLLARLNANGSFDSTFRPMLSGIAVNSIAVQPDGRILVGGTFDMNSGGVNYRSIVRLNSDGSVDNTFHIPLSSLFNRHSSTTRIVALLDDSSMLLDGLFFFAFPEENEARPFRLTKVSSDGSFDPAFQPLDANARYSTTIFASAVQPDGKILLSGYYILADGSTRYTIVRLLSDGTRDFTFDPTQGADNSTRSILPQPDGKILIGGNFTQFHSTRLNRIARLSANGEVDTSFDPGSGFNNGVTVLALQNDNKILVGGSFSTFDGQRRLGIVRLQGGDPASVAPKITTHPHSQSVPAGHNVIFEASATGFPLSYQWQKDGIDLPGETHSTLHIWDLKPTDFGSYQIVVSNNLGVATSAPAQLGLMPPTSELPSLIFNPSFEDLETPRLPMQWTFTSDAGWLLGLYPETAPINSLGVQFPTHGTNYLGLRGNSIFTPVADQRGPIFTYLKQQLVVGKKYEVSGWLSFPESQPSPTVDIQFSLSTTGSQLAYLPLNSISITNKKDWVPYRRTLIASKPYQQLWIGYPRAPQRYNEASVYVDDVNIFELPPSAPEFAIIPDQTVRFGESMILDLKLVDIDIVDQWPQVFLTDSTPTNAVVAPLTKDIRFRPTASQIPSTNTFTVIAAYESFPHLTSTQTFRVFVPDEVTLALGRGMTTSGAAASIPLTLQQVLAPAARLTNISFALQYPSDRITGVSALAASPSVASITVESTSPASSIITLNLHSAEPGHADSLLATLTVQTTENPATAAIPLTLSNITALKEDGLQVGVELGEEGTLFIIGDSPYISAQMGENGQPELLIYGKQGMDHVIESTETLNLPNSWKFVQQVTLTNLTHVVQGLDVGLTNVFFRVRR